MKKTDTEITVSSPIHGIALIQNPTLIQVRTISKRIADQMPFLDGEAGSRSGRVDFDGCQIVGSIGGYSVVVRDENEKLWRVRGIAFIMWQMNKHGASNEQANERLRLLPQLFES